MKKGYILRFIKRQKIFLMVSCSILLLSLISIVIFGSMKNALSREYTHLFSQYIAVNSDFEEENRIYLGDMLKTEFTNAQLKELVDRFYHYSILVNGASIKNSSGKIYTRSNRVDITVFEDLNKEALQLLPRDMVLTGSHEDITQVIRLLPEGITPTIERASYSNGNRTEIIYDELVPGSSIMMELDSGFADKLGLGSYTFEIVYQEGVQ